MAREDADAQGPANQPSAQDLGWGRAGEDLARQLAEAARDVQRETSPQEVMDRLVRTAVALVPGADEATISLTRGRREVVSAAVTSEVAGGFDVLQTEVGEGPCLETMHQQDVIRVDDLGGDERWPTLAGRIGELGLASMLCFRLFVHGETLGALDLLSRRPGAFDDESETVGLFFVGQAAVAMADAQQLEHVQSALASRDVIGQAKGILMERFKLTADQAFALLAKVSQDSNRKLRDVAEQLARTGSIGP